MPPIPLDIAQCALRFSLTGDAETMITTFGVATDLFTGDADDIATEVRTTWETYFTAADMSTNWTFLGVRVLLGQATGAPIPGSSEVSVPGTFSLSTLPQNSAFLFKKRTNLPGRSGMGRCYCPPCYGIGEGDVSAAGVIDSASVTAINTKLFNVLQDLNTANLPMVVWGIGPSTPQVSSFTLDPVIATRRRRLRR